MTILYPEYSPKRVDDGKPCFIAKRLCRLMMEALRFAFFAISTTSNAGILLDR